MEPFFYEAMNKGLTMWDTATFYASEHSETILGEFVKEKPEAIISIKCTPFLAENRGDNAMQELFDESRERLHRDVIDIYWIHNTQDVKKWTAKLMHY